MTHGKHRAMQGKGGRKREAVGVGNSARPLNAMTAVPHLWIAGAGALSSTP